MHYESTSDFSKFKFSNVKSRLSDFSKFKFSNVKSRLATWVRVKSGVRVGAWRPKIVRESQDSLTINYSRLPTVYI